MSLPSLRAGANAPLILLSLPLVLITGVLSCGPDSQDPVVDLRFATVPEAGTNRTIVRNVQFYVHDVELLDENGQSHPVQLVAAPPWQSDRAAWVDLGGDADAQGPAKIHGKLGARASTSSPGVRFTGIRFTVGVPFDLNHANPLAAAAPLDRGEMFWTWQSGYKFMRVDLAVDEREWSFHLGSAGCISASAVRPPGAPCAQPNRMRVELRGDPLRGVIRLQLAPLAVAARAANYAICTGNYAQVPACAAAYASTGLQPESGSCPSGPCTGQTLWTLE